MNKKEIKQAKQEIINNLIAKSFAYLLIIGGIIFFSYEFYKSLT